MMLKGIRIVDFSRYLPGPYAALRLADMGAEVIKVEPPGNGDPARVMGECLNGSGLAFLSINWNKKSVTINMKEQEGQEIAFQLACCADVVIEGFRPGVADALGIGYENLKQVRPDLVYCSLTGYGQTGPLRDFGGHDLNYLAVSGVLALLKDEAGRPIQPGIQFADLIGGMAASEAILAAIVKKGMTKEGSYLDLSMTDQLIGMMNGHVLLQDVTGRGNGVPELGGSIISYNLYETKDGRFISLGALEKKFWENFCRAIKKEKWIDDHLSPATEGNPAFLKVRDLFKSRTFEEWSKFSFDVDCCMAPVLNTEEMMKHQYVIEKGLLWEFQSEEWGNLCQAATSAGGSRAKDAVSSRVTSPPTLGQHNYEVFQSLLNVSMTQINEWEKRGSI